MPKFISLPNTAGGTTLFLRDQISAVEDQMGQTKLIFGDGTAEVVLAAAADVASNLVFTHTFPIKLATIYTDISRITRLASSMTGDADVFFGKAKVEVDATTGRSMSAILAAL